jgi:thiol-disulfide isomerase/thioredoxin
MTPDLERRRLLTSLAGAAVLGGGAVVVARSGGDPSALPIRVDTLDARGSSTGKANVPAPDGPLLLDLFATWCPPCAESMPALAAAAERHDGLQFLSVTNERFGGGLDAAALREWWRDHGGAWTLGHDPESRLMSILGADALPHLTLFDADGTVIWNHGGPLKPGALDTAIATRLDG